MFSFYLNFIRNLLLFLFLWLLVYMRKIKNFKISIKTREVSRIVKKLLNVEDLDIEVEEAIQKSCFICEKIIKPAVVYDTFSKESMFFNVDIEKPEKWIAVSLYVLTIGIAFLILNVLIGLICSSLSWVNISASSVAILLNTALAYYMFGDNVKTPFKISLMFIIPIITISEYLIALFMPNKLENNYALIIILILLFLESIIYLSIKKVSTK